MWRCPPYTHNCKLHSCIPASPTSMWPWQSLLLWVYFLIESVLVLLLPGHNQYWNDSMVWPVQVLPRSPAPIPLS